MRGGTNQDCLRGLCSFSAGKVNLIYLPSVFDEFGEQIQTTLINDQSDIKEASSKCVCDNII